MAAHCILLARHGREPGGDRLQHGVAGCMAVRVIYLLEVIEIKKHDRQGFPAPMRLEQAVFKPVIEQHPIGQQGQGVMKSCVTRRFFLLLRSKQLMLQHMALLNFGCQGRVDPRQVFGTCLHRDFDGFTLFHCRFERWRVGLAAQLFAQCRIDRGQFNRAFFDGVPDLFALIQDPKQVLRRDAGGRPG